MAVRQLVCIPTNRVTVPADANHKVLEKGYDECAQKFDEFEKEFRANHNGVCTREYVLKMGDSNYDCGYAENKNTCIKIAERLIMKCLTTTGRSMEMKSRRGKVTRHKVCIPSRNAAVKESTNSRIMERGYERCDSILGKFENEFESNFAGSCDRNYIVEIATDINSSCGGIYSYVAERMISVCSGKPKSVIHRMILGAIKNAASSIKTDQK